jgi:hypothetical protein
VFFGGEFPPFCKHEKGPSTSTNDFLKLKKPKFVNCFIKNGTLQWVLGHVTKI